MKERTKLLLIVLIFVGCYYIPWGNITIRQSGLEAFMMLQEYAREHVLTCLIPAFFIAGAIAVFVSQASVLKYFGATAKKILSYSVASVSGALMYFATLTEVPILQGLIGAGMGKGPALSLLLAGPALSLPNMLVIGGVMGVKKTAAFSGIIVILSTIAGMSYGWIAG